MKLSRSTPKFLRKLFAMEAPEVASGVVEIKEIAREAGSRSKVAVWSDDEYIDPVGACVGQRGVRVSTVMSALGNEKIDIIEWADNPEIFVEKALSPAEVMRVELNEDTREAHAYVMSDQQSLAIGKGGQNARLAAKLTGWKIDIRALDGGDDEEEAADGEADETAGDAADPIDDKAAENEEGSDDETTDSENGDEVEVTETDSDEEVEESEESATASADDKATETDEEEAAADQEDEEK